MPVTFGELLKRYRSVAGLTQEALADRAGLAVRTISDLERGLNHRPRKDTVRLMAHALQLDAADWVTFEEVARRLVTPVSPEPPAGSPPLDQPRATNLPPSATRLIGREEDTRVLDDLLRRSDVRLCTLTGPGGNG